MKIKRRPAKKARIEIIPMIDVIFFLLVFFMISSLAHDQHSGIPVHLPKTSSAPNAVVQKITLTIEASGNLFLNKEKVTLANLSEALAHLMAGLPDEAVIINADQGANYGLVMTAMDQAKKIGVRKFALLSHFEK